MGWCGYGVGWCGVQQDRVLPAMGEEGRRGLDGRCRREPQGRQHLAGFMMHAHIQAGVPWACMSPQQQTPEGAAWVAFAWRQLQATRRGGLLPPASPNHCQAALPGTTGMPALLSPAP